MTTSHNPKIDASPLALLGAYERDNFGDVLFLQLTREIIAPRRSVTAAPLGTLSEYKPLGLAVESLAAAARSTSLGGVWVVGGEVGGTSLESAYRMAATEQDYRAFLARGRFSRLDFLSKSSDRSPFSSPYLPRMSAASETLETRSVLNSVGLSGLAGLRGARAMEAWQAVREADYVSVRDRASSTVLTRQSVRHTLAPDYVHSLRLSRGEWMTRDSSEAPYALIQVKETTLQKFGPERLANTISTSAALRPFDIRLFVAGSARGHDSIELYDRVATAMAKLAPSRPISIINDLSPIEKAEMIARASVWIGTSLHGLIISSAFDVPRVGLELEKLKRYAETWAESMPVGVPLADLDAAAETALKTVPDQQRAVKLATAAITSAQDAHATLDSGAIGSSQLDERRASFQRFAREADSRWSRSQAVAYDQLRAWRNR